MENKRIVLEVYEHENSGWLLAKSGDLPGFYAQGESYEQLETRIPNILRRYLQSRGYVVESVQAVKDAHIPASFVQQTIVAEARLEMLAPA